MIVRVSLCTLIALTALACTPRPPAEVADVVILDAAMVTMDPAQPQASALAIRDGKIAFVGDNESAQKWVGEKTRVVRAAGATVLPGLIDSHIHAMSGALSLDSCTFADAQLALAEVAAIIRECVARTPGEGWVVVQDLNAAGFQADRKALDAVVPARPLLLWAADGHVGYANSAALSRAGITRNTPDPADGRIERDRKGEPTGFLVDEAMGLVSRHLDKPGPEQRERLLSRALRDIAAAGITTLMEANTDAETVATYVALASKKQLAQRVTFALESTGESTDQEFARLRGLRELAQSQPQLRADMIKLFADGIIEYPTQTAALLEPYRAASGRPGKNLGPLYHEPEALAQFVTRAATEGFGVHIHAIGDRAARVALDAFARARQQGSQRSYSIAHLELVDPADFPRFRELGVIASLQLQWAEPDNYTVEAALPYIGPERQARLYPARSFIAAGATIAGGSDWNVSTFNPFEAMATAVARTNPKEPQRGVLGADQALKLSEMFAAYTINAARMLGRDAEIGSLQAGKAADVVVLDRALNDSSSAEQIRGARVRILFANGTVLVGSVD
ncbi:MAG TPA: amidohydrolase [Steroidobacteraceae bacterium]|nr:amidohydrolase [Steroidobacteraceae bacterium]